MDDRAQALRGRVRKFAIRVLVFVKKLPHDVATRTVAAQLSRSGTAVSSNYHSVCRARSRAEFIAKLGVVLEEADESEHWLQLMRDAKLSFDQEAAALLDEAAQLRAIFKASVDTARRNRPI
jgi:four helix bundle protein